MSTKFLVTGANGYIAMHVVDVLLKQGFQVRGTIRSLNDKEKVESLKKLGPVELVEANLLDPQSLKNAVKGIDIVMHVASPVPSGIDDKDEDFIKPAVEGTLALLRAALEENVKKVVITSSTSTIYPFEPENRVYTEKDWLDPNTVQKSIYSAYQKSKILAERAAWDFYEEHKKTGKCFDLATILPSMTLGPILCASSRSSASLLTAVIEMNSLDDFPYMQCDVRDVALAHLRAAQIDEAVGKRFIIVSEVKPISYVKIGEILKEAGYKAASIKTKPISDSEMSNSNMRNILKIEPSDLKKTILDTAESLVKFGVIKK